VFLPLDLPSSLFLQVRTAQYQTEEVEAEEVEDNTVSEGGQGVSLVHGA